MPPPPSFFSSPSPTADTYVAANATAKRPTSSYRLHLTSPPAYPSSRPLSVIMTTFSNAPSWQTVSRTIVAIAVALPPTACRRNRMPPVRRDSYNCLSSRGFSRANQQSDTGSASTSIDSTIILRRMLKSPASL
ncbi:uncharacterized protein BDZ99DRAFT_85348 [Mytilinidion resinicola]|uniref:Uncharacterized protein n=1 Tax=Mytilinidion resinicola TaxID=574789 RepID=A0A6A6YD79_9PEZI|nr:uncharacterized protein BDZ99DRAFT_85348 [Mytilinidion resinicola]KAF2806786.1 hypothetical protein BDZ99DRAFT_85348 [Mytilinidion resinicola]